MRYRPDTDALEKMVNAAIDEHGWALLLHMIASNVEDRMGGMGNAALCLRQIAAAPAGTVWRLTKTLEEDDILKDYP